MSKYASLEEFFLSLKQTQQKLEILVSNDSVVLFSELYDDSHKMEAINNPVHQGYMNI